MREVSTSEALMTDPTTPQGTAYWQDRRDYEEALEAEERLYEEQVAAERFMWELLPE
jgi:hypothetical protein